VRGGGGTDTLRGTDGNDFVDLRLSAFTGSNGELEIFNLGAGDDVLIGDFESVVRIGLRLDVGEGTDIVSFFGVSTPTVDLASLDPSYSAETWTIAYGGQTSSFTTAALRADTVDFPSLLGIASTQFTFVDGGGGANLRVEGSTGSDIIFGGADDGILDGGGFDDRIYSGPGDDIMIGGADFDVFHTSYDWGDDFIFDGSTKATAGPSNGYSNGLILFGGFEENGVGAGTFRDVAILPDLDHDPSGTTADPDDNDKTTFDFNDNGDGTWTLTLFDPSSGNVDGKITFAADEIETIQLDNANTSFASSFIYEYDETAGDYVLQ